MEKNLSRFHPHRLLPVAMPSTDAREKPAWLDELRCASSLEKTFLYEEVFGTLHVILRFSWGGTSAASVVRVDFPRASRVEKHAE